MSELKDLLLKTWKWNVNETDVMACNKEITDVYTVNVKSLVTADFVPGRCRVWIDDDDIIKFIVLEQANGKILRIDSEPPLDTSDWPKRARLHRQQDPWS